MKLLSTFFREPFTLLHLAWTHCTQCVHLMEFTPTPFTQTLHGCFTLPTTCVVPVPKDSHITLVLSSFIFRPSSLRHSFHFLNFSFNSSSHFPTSTRSSAYSISHGRPSLTLCVTASITMMKSSDSALNLGVLQHLHQTTHLLTHHMILSWSWHVYTWPSLLLLTTLQHLSSSWPTQLLSLALCQRPSLGLQMPTTVSCVFPYISLVTVLQ